MYGYVCIMRRKIYSNVNLHHKPNVSIWSDVLGHRQACEKRIVERDEVHVKMIHTHNIHTYKSTLLPFWKKIQTKSHFLPLRVHTCTLGLQPQAVHNIMVSKIPTATGSFWLCIYRVSYCTLLKHGLICSQVCCCKTCKCTDFTIQTHTHTFLWLNFRL